MSKTNVRSGRAFMELSQSKASADAIANMKLRLERFALSVAAVMESGAFREAADLRRQQVRELSESLQRAKAEINERLESLGFDPTETLDEWAHLARISEMIDWQDDEGILTLDEIFKHATAWAKRLEITAEYRATAERKAAEKAKKNRDRETRYDKECLELLEEFENGRTYSHWKTQKDFATIKDEPDSTVSDRLRHARTIKKSEKSGSSELQTG